MNTKQLIILDDLIDLRRCTMIYNMYLYLLINMLNINPFPLKQAMFSSLPNMMDQC